MPDEPEALEPEAMTPGQLKDEVWYWRTQAAAELGFALLYLENPDLRSPFRARKDLRRRVGELRSLLSSALAGEVFEDCSICARPIKPGQALIRDVDMGDCHAECMGDPEAPRPGGVIRPGDVVLVEPESVVGPGDEPDPDSDGRLVTYAAERLYTTAQIAAKAAKAGVALGERAAV